VSEGGRIDVLDGGSANGTFVRGRSGRITRHELRDGDVIEAAGFMFIFLRE
jgi:autotransporter passenger strand-loop-strand repeat protein